MRYYIIKSESISPFTKVLFSRDMATHKETELIHFDFNNKCPNIPIAIVKEHTLLSHSIKEVFSLYSSTVIDKQILFVDSNAHISKSYYLFKEISGDYLSDKTTFHLNNSIKHMVLAKHKISGNHIFEVSTLKTSNSGIILNKLVVSLAVVESLLRRGITNLTFEEVTIDGGEYIESGRKDLCC